MTKPTSKSATDSAMALLDQAMDRNMMLSNPSPTEVSPKNQPATEPRDATPSSNRSKPRRTSHHHTTALRLNVSDFDRINQIVTQAMSLGTRIPMSDAIRMALIAYEPKKMTRNQLESVRSMDGRVKRAVAP